MTIPTPRPTRSQPAAGSASPAIPRHRGRLQHAFTNPLFTQSLPQPRHQISPARPNRALSTILTPVRTISGPHRAARGPARAAAAAVASAARHPPPAKDRLLSAHARLNSGTSAAAAATLCGGALGPSRLHAGSPPPPPPLLHSRRRCSRRRLRRPARLCLCGPRPRTRTKPPNRRQGSPCRRSSGPCPALAVGPGPRGPRCEPDPTRMGGLGPAAFHGRGVRSRESESLSVKRPARPRPALAIVGRQGSVLSWQLWPPWPSRPAGSLRRRAAFAVLGSVLFSGSGEAAWGAEQTSESEGPGGNLGGLRSDSDRGRSRRPSELRFQVMPARSRCAKSATRIARAPRP